MQICAKRPNKVTSRRRAANSGHFWEVAGMVRWVCVMAMLACKWVKVDAGCVVLCTYPKEEAMTLNEERYTML
jgi:hypothetical protein